MFATASVTHVKAGLSPVPCVRHAAATFVSRAGARPLLPTDSPEFLGTQEVRMIRGAGIQRLLQTVVVASTMVGAAAPAFAQAGGSQKPNILFIMGDDIGWMQPSI